MNEILIKISQKKESIATAADFIKKHVIYIIIYFHD